MKKRGPKRVHDVTVRLTFDRPCVRKFAVQEAWNNIYGEHYTDHQHPRPETFKAKVLKR